MFDLVMITSLFIGGVIQDGPAVEIVQKEMSELQCGNVATGAATVVYDYFVALGAADVRVAQMQGGPGVVVEGEKDGALIEVLLVCSQVI